MPLYDYHCPSCGFRDEVLMSWQKMEASEVLCTHCSLAMTRLPSLPAKTPMAWHGNWSEGLGSTMYSKALGRNVANTREESKIMTQRGFISERDLPKHWYEDTQAKIVDKRKQRDQLADTYANKLAEGKDPAIAMSETFTAEKCLSGELDRIYDDKITT